MTEPLKDRFWAKVKRGPNCWTWTAFTTSDGYGRLWALGVNGYAHRVSWMIHHGAPMPSRMVLHKCDNPRCVRPSHLFLGTQIDNMRDAVAKGRLSPSRNRGEKNGLAKLCEADVRAILKLHRKGRTQRELAERFGVSAATIWYLLDGRTWKHVTGIKRTVTAK